MGNFPQPMDKRLVAQIAEMERRLKRLEHIAADPVAVGSQLARTSIGSPNYTPGGTGWILNADGTGEVTNQVTVAAGGIKVTLGAVAPATPTTGDLWYDSTNGYQLNQWSGSAWVPYSFGTNAIAAGSITSALVAAGAITAAKIAAGTIIAGVVDSTTIVAPLLIGSQVLAYATAVPRGPTYYDFETAGNVQGWTAVNATLTQSSAWSSTGAGALLATVSGIFSAVSPTGTAGIPVQANDPIALAVDLQTPAATVLNAYVGIRWYDNTGAFISETDCPDTALTSGVTTTVIVSDIAPAAGYAALCFGNHGSLTAGTLVYGDNIIASGNLVYSTSPTGGTDAQGNVYSQGLEVAGLPGMKSVISITDPWGVSALLGIDSTGNISGQLATFADVFIGGQDFLTQILPALSWGLIARTNVFASSLPTTATSSEFYLYELDFQAVTGRSYMIVLDPLWLQFSGAGGCKISIYATTDGSNPTNASPLLMQGSVEASGTTGFSNVRSPTITKLLESSAGALWRMMVSFVAFGTGATPTISLQQLDTNPGDDAALSTNARMSVYDMGLSVPNTGRSILATAAGTGGGTRNYTGTWTANHTYCYQGSDGGNPNLKINTDGTCYQGGNFSNTYNGKSKTWITFPAAMISAISGATITNVQLYLNNNHTWYGSGMTAAIGWDNKSALGSSTSGDPSGAGIDISEPHFSQGQAKWVTLPNSVGNNLASGAANCIALFRNTNDLQYYGQFAGAKQSGPPQLKISYTK